MKSLQKLALATAIASAPFAANALEALDDEFLSDVSGQEGITIETNTYQTIEEFQYVDGDGDGSGAGKVVAKNISIGDFSSDFSRVLGVDGSGNPIFATLDNDTSDLSGVTVITDIDAAANGVLITNKQLGEAGYQLAGAGTPADPTDDVYTFGNGQDTHIGSIELGGTDASGNAQMASIGSVTILNQTNWVNPSLVSDAVSKYNLVNTTTATGIGLALAANNNFVEAQTLISSKSSGTGVHIATEASSIGAEAVYYTDTDGTGGNQVGVIHLLNFRLTNTDELGADQVAYADLDDPTNGAKYIRGSKTEFDLDVDGGKLVLSNYKSQGSTIMNKIFIGEVNSAYAAGAGVIGSIGIYGNTTQGTISISAH